MIATNAALFIPAGATIPQQPDDHPSWQAWGLDQPWPEPRWVYLLASGEVLKVCYFAEHVAYHCAEVEAANAAAATLDTGAVVAQAAAICAAYTAPQRAGGAL